ncbi:MAG: hypothetical protein WA208_15550, partial [Thermoanaerobaculia bacterium]
PFRPFFPVFSDLSPHASHGSAIALIGRQTRSDTRTKRIAHRRNNMVALLVIAIFLTAVTLDHFLHRASHAGRPVPHSLSEPTLAA